MIHTATGDLFESHCDALVNPVNCVGVAGRGLAAQFRTRYPDDIAAYSNAGRNGRIHTGEMFTTCVNRLTPTIVHFPTKDHWRYPSQMNYITDGLVALRRTITQHQFETIAVPALGCGHGGLRWDEVRDAIRTILEDLDVRIEVYEP